MAILHLLAQSLTWAKLLVTSGNGGGNVKPLAVLRDHMIWACLSAKILVSHPEKGSCMRRKKKKTGKGKIATINSSKGRLKAPVEVADLPEETSSGESSIAETSMSDDIGAPADEASAASDYLPSNNGNNRRFWPPSRQQVLTACAFGGVVLLGAILRFWG